MLFANGTKTGKWNWCTPHTPTLSQLVRHLSGGSLRWFKISLDPPLTPPKHLKSSPPASRPISVLIEAFGDCPCLGSFLLCKSPWNTLFSFCVCQRSVTTLLPAPGTEPGHLPLPLSLPLAPGHLSLAGCMFCCCSLCLRLIHHTGGGTEQQKFFARVLVSHSEIFPTPFAWFPT